MASPDPFLGWRNKEGSYLYPSYVLGENKIQVTILPNGTRLTGFPTEKADKQIVFLGGSFTFGSAISDHETFTWKLQENFPEIKMLNYGAGAFGTYQSLLLLEEVLSTNSAPLAIFYGLINGHEMRNVAGAIWLRDLARFSRRGQVSVPFATVNDKNELVRHKPQTYSISFLSRHLSTVNVVQELYMKISTWKRESRKRVVTQRVLIEMDKLSRKFGAEFRPVLLLMDESTQKSYHQFFQKNGIQFIDCNYAMEPQFRVPGEGHPNEKLNTLWAHCISNSIMEMSQVKE
jgi:hypothetical protein